MVITLLVFLLILSVLVLIHEAGHYFVAKKLGIKVEEFGFGFPLTPPLWQKKIGETVYSFYPVLIGGFVKLYGEDDAGGGKISLPKEEKESKARDLHRAFFTRPLWQRTLVVVAGVVMNALLAVFIYYVFLSLSGFKTVLPLLGEQSPGFVGVNQELVPKGFILGKVAPDSPADGAGIKPGSVLLSINGKKLKSNDELVKTINSHKGREMTLEWYDATTKKKNTATVIPRVSPPKGQGSLGIAFDYSPYNVVIFGYDTPEQKILSGFSHTYNLQLYNMVGLGTLFNQAVAEKNIEPISKNVAGPIGIGALVGQIVEIPSFKDRILQLLNLAGILSISLAFFNVLPIPGLDGGRLFFIILEGVIGKKVNPKVEGYFHAVGMILLIALLLLVTIKDIAQLPFFK